MAAAAAAAASSRSGGGTPGGPDMTMFYQNPMALQQFMWMSNIAATAVATESTTEGSVIRKSACFMLFYIIVRRCHEGKYCF